MKAIILFVFILCICSCKSENEKYADKMFEEFESEIEKDSLSLFAQSFAEYIADHHYDEKKKKIAKMWLTSFTNKMAAIETKANLETKQKSERLENLGGVTLIGIDSKEKCNLFKGYYYLNKKITDSADLAFIAKYLADGLFRSSKKDAYCSYPLMTQVAVYRNRKDYDIDIGEWISLCNITPQDYSGDVTVATWKLNKY